MGSWWVGSGIPGVAAGSCAPCVASGLGVEEMVLRSLVHLELGQVEKSVPVVLVLDLVPGDARMVLPPALVRRVEILTGAPSVGSPLFH